MELLPIKYTKGALTGLSSTTRQRLAELLRTSKGSVTVSQASAAWGMPHRQAAKALAHFAVGGWLARVRRGLYIPVALDATSTEPVVEDGWLLAKSLFEPCYIGGWSAAEHWDLTEQIFSSVIVVSTRRPRKRTVKAGGVEFNVKTVLEQSMFGIQEIWRSNVKVAVSTPAKTIVDMLDDPAIGGGIRPVDDVLAAYRRSKYFNAEDLAAVCNRFDSGAVFKRLGYLLERSFPDEKALIELCLEKMSKGNAKLDPGLTCPRLSTKWRLWVPDNTPLRQVTPALPKERLAWPSGQGLQ